MSAVSELVSRPESAGSWTLVPDRSRFTFKNKTFWGLMNVTGRFSEFSGEGRIGDDGAVTGHVAIKAASLNTGNKRRDEHLRSPDFFDVEHFPEITVTVNGVDPADGEELNVRADLSVRGHSVVLPLRVRAEVADDGTVRLATTTTVEREQLGVSGNLVGMVGPTTTLAAEAVFRRTGP